MSEAAMTIAYTEEEGGLWLEAETAWTFERWALWLYAGGDHEGHSIRFPNGRIWDRYLGCFRDEYRLAPGPACIYGIVSFLN